MYIKKYRKEDKAIWNQFVESAKNSHFFFLRDYMDYHKHRFNDFSLLIFNKNDNLIAVLPANANIDTIYSHQGLTFGGFIIGSKTNTQTILEIFKLTIDFLKNQNFKTFVYKTIPHIYHKKPAEEDQFALFNFNASLIKQEVSSTIDLQREINYSRGKRWSINKNNNQDITIVKSVDFEAFWEILSETLLQNHNSKPVHSLEEIKQLANAFPNNIKLYLAKKGGELLAGTVIYENEYISHAQYMANTPIGREYRALDILLDHIIKHECSKKRFFDLGTSNGTTNGALNIGLLTQKTEFGASAVVHNTYKLTL